MSKLASERGASTLSKSSVWQMWTSEAAARQPGAAGSRELAWARPGLSPAVGGLWRVDVGDCYQLAGNRDGRADRDGDGEILDWVLGLDWIFFFCSFVFPKAGMLFTRVRQPLRNADSAPRKWPSPLEGVSMARPQTPRGNVDTKPAHV